MTGGSGGIGRVTSERLARDSIAVAVHYAGNKARANGVVEAIASSGGQAVAVGGNVADEQAMIEAFDAVEQKVSAGSTSSCTPPGGSSSAP